MAKKKMEPGKKVNYDVFRFQLSPKSGHQYSVFGESLTSSQIKARKNIYFHEALLKIQDFTSFHGNKLYHKILVDKDNITAFKIGPSRKVHLENTEFEPINIDGVLHVQVVINNDPSVQKIAITRNKAAFDSSFVVANMLAENINRQLESYGLEVSINPVLKKEDFWKLIQKYENNITSIKFELVRPNITNISETLADQLKGLVELTNSNRTNIELKAAPGRVLENISPENKPLKEIADYVVKGGSSDVHIKVKGYSKTIRTNSTIETFSASEIEISGNIDDVKLMYNHILTD